MLHIVDMSHGVTINGKGKKGNLMHVGTMGT